MNQKSTLHSIDEKLITTEQKVVGDVKTIIMDAYQEQTPHGKLAFILIAVLIIALIIWVVGHTTLGFMYTPLGILLIGLTVVAVIVFAYMRSKGVGLQSWSGGIVTVLLVVVLFVVYIGLLGAITETVLMFAPFLIIGSVAFIAYSWYKHMRETDPALANGIIAMGITFCVVFPVYQAFVVPYTLGTPVQIKIDVMKGGDGTWTVYTEMSRMQFVTTMNTQFNPYMIATVEFSNWMWSEINTVEKVYVDITVQHDSTRSVIYTERGHVVYVGDNSMKSIWGVIHLPPESEMYIREQYRIVAQVYNLDGILETWSGVYTHN